MIRLIPLGGLGEIGMNAMIVAYENDAIMIDCGVLFPDPEMHGIDLVIPDFSVLKSLKLKLHGYVITHGHEDHIGALPYALQVQDAPIFASRFTCGLIQHKLGEWGLTYALELVRPRQTMTLGPFELEFLSVTHSIPDGLAIAIGTPLGTVIHTGDFKIDHRPVGGETTDLARFGELGDRGVLALLSDSTNAEIEGVSQSEAAIADGLEQAMRDAQGRIFIASFASHVYRMQTIIDLSQKLGRKIVLNGRSMVNNCRIARDLGVLKVSDDMFVPLEQAKERDPKTLTILTTGSQAEPTSAIAKLAFGEGQHLSVSDGDLVIFSSRSIPGNERAITKAIDGLTRRGAEVLYWQVAKVHTSGHAHKEEQRLMINLCKPRFFVPIHGELHHLKSHARTAAACRVDAERVFTIEDGQSLELQRGDDGEVHARLGERHVARKIFVDGKGIGDVGEAVIRDRAQLAHAGMVICVVTIDQTTGDITQGPDLLTKGIFGDAEHPTLFEEAKQWVRKGLEEHTAEARCDRPAMEESIRASLRRFFRKELERKPVVLPLVLNV
ncbi:MAG: ribonuclease J [Deltaproteobacteria bacterium]|nr:ribonuclease J [Deltaproteobacteria bacterium]